MTRLDLPAAADGAIPAPEHLCPLCNSPNACAPAQCGRFDTPCWCRTATFPASLLACVPPEKRGRACICAACAEAANRR